MAMHVRRLLTVVTESSLERALCADLERLGARGWTVTEARGGGHRGQRSSGWEPDANVRIEVICDAGLAAALAEYLRATYSDHYAMVLFVHDVEVLRPDKF